MVRKASVRTLCATTGVLFLGAIVGRPILDPSCLGHHTESPGGDAEHAASPRSAAHASFFGPTESDRNSHDSALMQACLCWFAGMASTPPSFEVTADVAPVHPPAPTPVVAELQPVPFALPFANGPPVLG